MNYKDILIQLVNMTVPYVYDDTVTLLELDRKLYKIVHELVIAMQGLSEDYDNLKTYIDDYFKNLNLESEVQRVINQMVDDGTLANIINEELLTEINQNIDKLTSDIETINNSITTINEKIDTANTNINTNSENIKTLKNKTQIQNATCEENANYILVNPDFKIDANDVIFIHFNPAIDKSADATLTINNVAKNVIKEDGSLYKGTDIENKDLILKVASAGLIQVVDIADIMSEIKQINENVSNNTASINALNETTQQNSDDITDLENNLINRVVNIATSDLTLTHGVCDASSMRISYSSNNEYFRLSGVLSLTISSNLGCEISLASDLRPSKKVTIKGVGIRLSQVGNTSYDGTTSISATINTDGTITFSNFGTSTSTQKHKIIVFPSLYSISELELYE